MGRGRAKAKQTKVARELKYYSPDTDLTALERELHQQSSTSESTSRYDVDPYADDADPVDEDIYRRR